MILKYCLCLWKSVKISLDDNTNEPVQLFFDRCKFHVSGSIKMFTFYTGIGSWTSKMFWFLNSIYIRNLPSLVLSLMERCIIWLYSLYMYSIQHLKQNIENIRENHNFWFNIWYFMQHLVRTNRTMKQLYAMHNLSVTGLVVWTIIYHYLFEQRIARLFSDRPLFDETFPISSDCNINNQPNQNILSSQISAQNDSK